MFNFFKKKPEKKPERTDLFKGIKVFVYYTNEMYLSYLKYHIENVSTEIKIVYFTDLEQMIKGMTEQKPNFLITILFGLKGLSAFDRSELQDIVKKLKSASNSTTLIGIDGMLYPELYLRTGFDFYIHLNKAPKNLRVLLYKILLNQELQETEKALIYEKKDFYDYVAKNGLFNIRAKKTANSNEELKFLHRKIKGKTLDAGCGNGRLTIPLASLGHEIIGADISKELIIQALKNKRDSKYPVFINANLLHTPFKDGEFNTVIMMWHIICEFRKYRFDLLKEMSRITSKGGRLIFDVPITSKKIKINEYGVYENKVDSFAKYVGLVPDLEEMLVFLHGCGFRRINYQQVNWGANKIVIIAEKVSFL